MKKLLTTLILFISLQLSAEDGYRLWLRYDLISNPAALQSYRRQLTSICILSSPAAQSELRQALTGLLGKPPIYTNSTSASLIIGTSSTIKSLIPKYTLDSLGEEGFLIRSNAHSIIIAANTDIGVLYGTFAFLRLLQENRPISNLNMRSKPFFHYRMLDHWDNLNRFVERGYAGLSLWDWQSLPDYKDKRYTDYARANASIGINGVVLNNVNANPLILTRGWIDKVAALANIFRPYGIKVYLSAKFSAPIEIGGLKTADPLDKQVQQWWKEKVDQIYKEIPDFGGFLVKANSEGQPGPQNYGRTHADGANMLATALKPHHGIVIWRAFVYSSETSVDRARQAYNEFKPLDGKFNDNVWVQVKNGAIDFQPREPFHPLFGAMPKTQLMPEFQLTQEYLGFATHLVYLAPLLKETLSADTYVNGPGSTVARVVAPGIAAVANTGNDINWCGHPFAQANWYAYGRLAWDPDLTAAAIAEEWIRQTFTNDRSFTDTVKRIMLSSRETLVNYMTPLGLHHIMGYNHHYGPAPWYDSAPRADWNPVYYHKADTNGIGFSRTFDQYAPGARPQLDTTEKFLLWFHHTAWDQKLRSGRTLWEELCYRYYAGVDSVRWMRTAWDQVSNKIDRERREQIQMLLQIQEKEAAWWRDACLSYFRTFARRPLPAGCEPPTHDLDYYRSLSFPYAPGIQSK